jgi:SAM-dependent methyltransferase
MFFADPAGAFANVRRAMRPGAPLVFVCFRALAECPWFGVPFAAARPHLTAQPPADPDAPGPFAFARAERVAGILSDAGFSDIRLTAADPVMRSGDLDQAVTTALRFGPVARALGDADQEQRRAVEQAVRAALAERETADGVRLSAGVWLVSAAA